MSNRGNRQSESVRAQRPERAPITFRKMKFDFEDRGFSKQWHDDNAFISYFWAALSAAFPPGETFFINSARNLRDQLDDEELKEEIAVFLLQEGHHTFQHRKFNTVVREQGFNMDRFEERFARQLDRARRFWGPMGQLAVTVALEHFTAGLARQYLSNPRIARGAEPSVVALWSWHSAEEAEHKATCFDIYQQLGGSYLERVSLLPVSWALILTITLRNLFDMLQQDEKLLDLRDNLKGLRYLFGFRGLVTSMMPAFFAYLRPGFHPFDKDDSSMIAKWQQANARYLANPQINATAG